MKRDFALMIDPDGTVDELSANEGNITGQHRMIHTYLGKGYATVSLGRFLLHEPRRAFPQQANVPAQKLWMGLSGGSTPPIFRGSIIVTARRRPDGSYPALLPGQLDQLHQHIGTLTWTPPTRPLVTAAQAKGTRKEQCDALAVHNDPATGAWAFVVCDGVGDSAETQAMAGHFARRIAIMGAEAGDPAAAVHAARAELDHWIYQSCLRTKPTATVAAAVWSPRAEKIRIAWAGDTRIYAMSSFGLVDLLTEDHNVAAYNRARGAVVREGDEHRLLAAIDSGPVGERQVHRDLAHRLLLCTDGAYGPLEAASRSGVSGAFALMPPKEAVGALVTDSVTLAEERSWAEWGEVAADNATALIVSFGGL
ncbi:PP2C family protein-serine/threonine phosphatase [Kitasatospora cineracea]|uniref:PP2C family protein-serine/threonine phosphatase n=1 Tax=Kitasatospora cineracea TaxID=88074 RepID=UPI0033E946D4